MSMMVLGLLGVALVITSVVITARTRHSTGSTPPPLVDIRWSGAWPASLASGSTTDRMITGAARLRADIGPVGKIAGPLAGH
jgi:hypothetical protein